MHVLSRPRLRLSFFILWCLSWPGIALALLTPLPVKLISRSDLLAHFLLFGVMALAVVVFARSRWQIIVLGLLSIIYGVALEFGQAYVPNRTFDIADAIANATGGIAGCLTALALLEYWIKPALTTAYKQS
jgi:VanZ family protein